MEISGPTYVFRLEGNIEEKKKIIYLFGEHHDNNNKCLSINSQEIDKYFEEHLASEENIDFFLEIFTNFEKNDFNKNNIINTSLHGDSRLSSLRSFFYKNLKNKKFNNVRFQFIDLRDIILTSNNMSNEDKIDFLLKIIKNPIKNNYKYNRNENFNFENYTLLLNNIIYKIKNVYDNNYVKIILNEYLENIENWLKAYKVPLNIQNKRKVTTYTINNSELNIYPVETIHNIITPLVLLIDIYALRRILDKNYTKKSILYTGYAHTFNYLEILLKKFNFKLTHINNIIEPEKVNDIQNLLEKVGGHDNYENILDLNPDNQCVNISHFPKNFD